ncbi:MAG TPA: IMP dehydrogenase, partial [Candidatus Limnocylindrales bacterium]|nr:IMP dehydrogenase [Candidatus Limnocylindrales bacterium]
MLDRPPSPPPPAGSPGIAARPRFRSKVETIRPTYGFDDVSLAPGVETVEPAEVELGQTFCGLELRIPVLAAAMDAVVDPAFAGALARLGVLAVLNLEG